MIEFFKRIWLLHSEAPKAERFLLMIILAFGVIDLFFLEFVSAAVQIAIWVAAVWMSYKDMLWFNDNEDDILLADVVDILKDNAHVRVAVVSQIVSSSDGLPSSDYDAVAEDAIARLETKL